MYHAANENRKEITTKLLPFQELPSNKKSKKYAEDMELPLLASCPYLGEVIQKNLSQSKPKPLIKQSEIREKWEPSFEQIRSHIQESLDQSVILKKKPLLYKIKKFLSKH